jgi:hypothetical protein
MRLFAELKGAKQLERALMNASDKLTRKVLISAMRQAATPIVKAMRANTPVSGREPGLTWDGGHRSGDLRESIGKIIGKSKRHPTLYIGPRVKGRFKYMGYIGHWVEFGNDTGYNVPFEGRRFAQKAYEQAGPQAEAILDEKILKAATKFLK